MRIAPFGHRLAGLQQAFAGELRAEQPQRRNRFRIALGDRPSALRLNDSSPNTQDSPAPRILEQGGNAIDAGIAANAVLGLVEPESDGLGGDLFAIYYEAKTKKLYGLNASGWTPRALTIDYLKSKGVTAIDPIGVESIDVPGAVAGWDAMRTRFGTRSRRC